MEYILRETRFQVCNWQQFSDSLLHCCVIPN